MTYTNIPVCMIISYVSRKGGCCMKKPVHQIINAFFALYKLKW